MNSNINRIKPIIDDTLYNAQEFIKSHFDISSVSLREIRRWEILFCWFFEFIQKPVIFNKFQFSDYDLYLYSLNLSIYLCYYMRIFKKETRKQFLNEMKKSFGSEFDFEDFPKKIQEIIADAVELDKGIAKNRPLLENLFAIFVCLNTRIPLFIVGKPGCSKSLSAQLIFKSMKGEDSSNDFFKCFPKVYTKSYQGSKNSNSSGILKIFNKARNSLKNNNLSNEIISAIYFDEMGLAEISNNNPLKVLHSELEYDDNIEKISFIGISNWPLDASKMNRGIYLSIPEPDEKDLTTTALAIAESYDSKLKQNYNQQLENLAKAYHEYKIQLMDFYYKFESVESASSLDSNENTSSLNSETNDSILNSEENRKRNIKEFHGTRDYYHLIKTFSKLLIEHKFPEDIKTIKELLSRSIERNFGGLENSVKIFKEIYQKYDPDFNFNGPIKKEYNVMECITSNIKDPKSRYLLLITNSQIDQFLISLILKKLNKNQTFYCGSKFDEDIYKGYYCAKVLNKIQVTMSTDNVMVLKDLEGIYPSLYDFFNQNFRKVGESEYARIALGDSNTQNYIINDNLKCIILLDKNEINKQDPPFLNRFEKHFITFKYLLNDKLIDTSDRIDELINDIIKTENKISLNVDLKNELVNCDTEEIKGLIYKFSNELKDGETDQIEKYNKEKIYNKIVPTFSQDIIFYAKNSLFSQKHKDDFETILDIFTQKPQNLRIYLKNIISNKHIIYTFSNILDAIFKKNNEIIENKYYGSFTKDTTMNIFVNQYNSERAIEGMISEYYNNNKYNLFILHFNTDDCIHLNHINYLISNIENSFKETNKVVKKVILFIIHHKRISSSYKNNTFDYENNIINNEKLISHLAEWEQCFIDNLNGININFKEILESNNNDLFNNRKLINLDEEFMKDLFHSFTAISYKYKVNFSSIAFENYIESVCEYINSNKNLKNMIQKSIDEKIKNIKGNLFQKIFSDYSFEENDVDFISVIIKYIKSLYNEALTNTIIQFEKNNILSTILLNKENDVFNDKYFLSIYQDCIDKFSPSNVKFNGLLSSVQKIDLLLGISYPCVISIFNKIKIYINEIIKDYRENEHNIRYGLAKEDYDYFYNKNLLENNLKVEFERYYIGEIFKNENNINLNINTNKERLIKLLLKDYIIYYLSKSNGNFENKNILTFFYSLYKIFISNSNNGNGNNNDEQFSISNIAKFVLFIESYKECIYYICESIVMMDKYFNNFTNDFISILSSNKFKYPIPKFSCVNQVLYNLFESFIHCILMKQNFNKINEKTLKSILNDLKTISNRIMTFNIDLRLILKQILLLNDLVLITEYINEKGMSLMQNLPIYYEILKNENKVHLLNEGLSENDPVDSEFQFLKNKFSNKSNYIDLIIKIINNKMKISQQEEYRGKLINIIGSDNRLIIKSKIIFEIIFKRFKLCPRNTGTDDAGLIFLSELNNNKNNSLIKTINAINNRCLDEILLSLFDKEFSKYFRMKRSKENLILSQSLSIFKECVKYIEKEKARINSNNKIGILYCISYIKYYCYYLSKVVYEDNNDELNIYEITEFLKAKSAFRSVIKLYIIKILNILIINNYNETIEFIKKKSLFDRDFDFTEKFPCSLEHLFIQNDSFNQYKELRKEFINSKNENFRFHNNLTEMINENNGNNKLSKLFNFYDLMVNEEISHFSKVSLNENRINELSQFTLNIINSLGLSPLSENILKLVYDSNSIKRELPFIKSLPLSTYEMLLYAHKFAFMCSLSKANSVYSNILSPNVLNNLNNIYIPGGEPNDNLLIKSGEQIYEYSQKSKDAIYKCSCHDWYFINRTTQCGFPAQTSKCRNCGQQIGGENHKLVEREGHVRVLNETQRPQNYEVPFILLVDLMKEVEKERKKQIKGLKRVKKNFYLDNDKKVRNISIVTYRILNFIFFSCIYYNTKLGYLKPNDLKNFYYSDAGKDDESILSIIKDNWNALIKELQKSGIENIQCFLNLIFPEIAKIILENNSSLQRPEERDEFENKCNNVIENAIRNYKINSNTFIENNKKILDIKDITIKSIVQETSDLNNLSQMPLYPLINYFIVTKYPEEDSFYEQFEAIPNSTSKYPVMTAYLTAIQNKDNDINDISEIFTLINPFIIYVLEKYNNKISRKDAKNIKIMDELDQDQYMGQLFESFQKGWEKIYKKLTNYDCHGDLPPKNITKEDCLAYVLNDNFEDGYGKYIASAYKTIITCQNEFLSRLISNHPKKIIVQKASPKEIVSFTIKNDLFNSFDDIISVFSNRNYSYENGKFDYSGYKNIQFDFDSIENELSKLLLPGKKLFKGELEQEFINYAFEAFNQDETIITKYKDKIQNAKSLSTEERTKLNHAIKGMDYNKIIFNLQSLFLYFINKKNITGNEILFLEIKNLPENIIKLDNEFINIFNRLHSDYFDLQLNQLIDFYEYIEWLIFPKIIRNLPRNTELSDEEFKSLNLLEYINAYNDLSKEQVDKLNKHFENKELLITKSDLRGAIRKYISRYMVSERFKKFNTSIFDEISYKDELWKDQITSDENEERFYNEIHELNSIKIKVGQTVDLYKKLRNEGARKKLKRKKPVRINKVNVESANVEKVEKDNVEKSVNDDEFVFY